MRLAGVPVAVRRVHGTRVLRHEQLDRLTEQLFAVVAEEPPGLRVREDDSSALVDSDECVGRGFEESYDRLVD
jgi:hypothetical protein